MIWTFNGFKIQLCGQNNHEKKRIYMQTWFLCLPFVLLLASSVELVVRHGCTGCRSSWNNKIKWIQIHYLQQLSLDKNTILVFSTVFSKLSCRSTPSSKISAALLYIALPPFQIRETIDFFLFSYYSSFYKYSDKYTKTSMLKVLFMSNRVSLISLHLTNY